MTPIRRQYLKIKQSYPEAIVFFRLGDFYETFDEDAHIASRELEIVLTSREMGKGQKVPMAGIPYHAVDNYLAKLVSRGYKVAICEQLSPPTAKGLVARDVVRVVTPGTVVEPALLESKANNYLAAVVWEKEEAGIAYADITTGEFATTQLSFNEVLPELERLRPAEILLSKDSELSFRLNASLTHLDGQWFEKDTATELLLKHFGVATLEGFGCVHLPLAIRAAGAVIHYLEETQKAALGQLTRLATYSTRSFMLLDAQTRRNLELFPGGDRESASSSLLPVLDLTKTPMGGRLLKKWLGQPLLDLDRLNRRLDGVAWFFGNTLARNKVLSLFSQIADLERLVSRIKVGVVLPRELVTLRRSLEAIPELKTTLGEDNVALAHLLTELRPCPDIVVLLFQAIMEEPGASPGEGTVIKAGFSPELDELKSAARNAKDYLARLERQERERTGIKTLKVGYNRVFGYYIEVSKPNLSQVPSSYIRKQTLTDAERFYTPELKEYESTILNAQERMAELESTLFRQVCQQAGSVSERLLALAGALAELDVLAALAQVAARNGYVRPQLNDENKIVISKGRHPVVEQALAEERFVPNDTYLSNEDAQLLIITGPNMSGKSTYLRQVALIVLLAQIGSFVPAESATIGLVDRIFTRVGLRDELARGQSTFMVEMVETANILNNATPRSLLVLDEIGRGTSTYDGISIARAVAEYIHNHPRLGAKTLFATHYHEMVEMARFLPRVKNFNVAVTEEGGKVVFLRQIVPGGADKSYGIHVAQLAGLPRSVVKRAQEILMELEERRPGEEEKKGRRARSSRPAEQLPLLGQPSPLLEELARLDLDSLTPLEALTKLYELKKKAKER